jgi:hypothetical protein
MAPIVTSIEIARPPEEVFDYVIDPSRFVEWEEGVISGRCQRLKQRLDSGPDDPAVVGSAAG